VDIKERRKSMVTKVKVVNDAYIPLDENMSRWEALIRMVLSAALVGVLFAQPAIGFKILFVMLSVYLFATAIIKWDPAYALVKRLTVDKASLPSFDSPKGILVTDMAAKHARRAGNDSQGSGDGLKKAG
jgi:hypothetical protein